MTVTNGVSRPALRLSAVLVALTMALALLPRTGAAQDADDACPEAAPESDFSDRDKIPDAHVGNVDCAAHFDIVSGFEDGTYRPQFQVRRDQMASFIALMLDAADVELPQGDADTFDDVPDSNVHADNINRLAAAGIVEGGPLGLPANEYGPELRTRRDQMASFLMRAAGFALHDDIDAFDSNDQQFTDVPSGNAHFAKVNGAAKNGIAQGTGGGLYAPREETRRDQMATFVVRLLCFLICDRDGPVLDVVLDPTSCEIGGELTATATLSIEGDPVEGQDVDFATSGVATTPDAGSAETDAAGEADFTFTVVGAGTLTVTATWSSNGQDATGTAQIDCGVVAAWDVALSWLNEVDDSDPDNPEFRQGEEGTTGDARLVVTELAGSHMLAFELDASAVTAPFCDAPGAHLHQGGLDENGPVVVFFATCADLQATNGVVAGELTDDDFSGGVTIQDVLDDPESFYVNVHSAAFPPGAIRGQLPDGGQGLIPQP
ncbi:MAG: S-layer homology domain-containing protein [Egibacteraceae bacterium]